MTISIRRYIYVLVFALFFIVAPILALYASGFRFDLSTNSIDKVGALYVKSYPAGADVFVDTNSNPKQTPARFLNLKPGIHTVTISEPGFQSWTKGLPIYEGQTTFVRDVVLFKPEQPPTQIATGYESAITSSDRSLLLYASGDTIYLVRTETSASFEIEAAVQDVSFYDISNNNQLVLLSSNNELSILDINTERIVEVPTPAGELISAQWDKRNDRLVWVIIDNTLYEYDTLSRTTIPVLNEVLDIRSSTSGNAVIYRVSQQNKLALFENFNTDPIYETSIDVNPGATIEHVDTRQIAVSHNGTLSVFFTDGSNSPLIVSANQYDWNGNRLLYANDFEVQLYYFDTETSELIDRTSSGIGLIQWHPSGSYFIKQKNNTVEIVEIDGRDVRNTARLTSKYPYEQLFFDQKGEILYALSNTRVDYYIIQ